MSSRFDRRKFLGASGALGAGLVLGCGSREASGASKGGQAFAGRTLRVFVYSGSWERAMRETFVPRFQEATGATVVLDPGWWDSIPKLKASPPGKPAFDLVLTDATQGYPAIREGMFQPIDLERIPNKENFAPSALANWVYEQGYGIPFPDSVMTLAYHRELVPFEPKTWDDLLRPEVAGKLGLYNSFYMSLHTFAAMRAAAEKKPGTAHELMERDLQGVLAYAKDHRELVKYWWPTSTDMALNLSQQNCALGNMHSTDMLPALRQHPQLGAVVPEHDRAFVLLMWVVPTGTQQKELAELAIDYLLSDEMQTAFARNGGTTASLGVAREMAAADPTWGSIYPSTEQALAAIRYYPYDAYFAAWDDIVAFWDEHVLRKSG